MDIIDRKVEFSTPWFDLVAKRVAGETAPYYALRMQDYVSVVAFTKERELLLVRQYRPAVERFTLELPSGQVEKEEPPEESARRELAEECGYEARELEHLGTLLSDTGRHENRLWCYLASDVVRLGKNYVPERGVKTVRVAGAELGALLRNAEFDHALHFAALMLLATRPGYYDLFKP
jgi:ADP-ribose pyrophosphatase